MGHRKTWSSRHTGKTVIRGLYFDRVFGRNVLVIDLVDLTIPVKNRSGHRLKELFFIDLMQNNKI